MGFQLELVITQLRFVNATQLEKLLLILEEWRQVALYCKVTLWRGTDTSQNAPYRAASLYVGSEGAFPNYNKEHF